MYSKIPLFSLAGQQTDFLNTDDDDDDDDDDDNGG